MTDIEKVIENMNIAKAVLCNPNMVTPEMCIKIGQTISDTLSLLKEQNICENCAIAIEDRQPVVRCKDCWKREFDNCPFYEYSMVVQEDNFFCADGEKMIQPNVWYNKKVTPPYGYELLLSDGVKTWPGYCYNHRFYVEDIDVTEEVTQWCIVEEGEIPCVN